jgi:hypothetical protein
VPVLPGFNTRKISRSASTEQERTSPKAADHGVEVHRQEMAVGRQTPLHCVFLGPGDPLRDAAATISEWRPRQNFATGPD